MSRTGKSNDSGRARPAITRRIHRKKPASDDPSISRFFELFFDQKPEPRGRPPEYRVDVLRERLTALTKELTRRYKKQGTWPETGIKWAADTEKYLRRWWRHGLDELAEWQRLPERPFPTEAIAVRLTSPKGIGGLKEMTYFLLSARLGCSPHRIQSLLRQK